MAERRRMSKRPAGSVTCDGGTLTVIDESQIGARRVDLRCQCGRRHTIDATPAVKIAIEHATVGALSLPAGEYRAVVNIGHSGQVLSAQLVKD